MGDIMHYGVKMTCLLGELDWSPEGEEEILTELVYVVYASTGEMWDVLLIQ